VVVVLQRLGTDAKIAHAEQIEVSRRRQLTAATRRANIPRMREVWQKQRVMGAVHAKHPFAGAKQFVSERRNARTRRGVRQRDICIPEPVTGNPVMRLCEIDDLRCDEQRTDSKRLQVPRHPARRQEQPAHHGRHRERPAERPRHIRPPCVDEVAHVRCERRKCGERDDGQGEQEGDRFLNRGPNRRSPTQLGESVAGGDSNTERDQEEVPRGNTKSRVSRRVIEQVSERRVWPEAEQRGDDGEDDPQSRVAPEFVG